MLDYEWMQQQMTVTGAADHVEPSRPIFHPYGQTGAYAFNPEVAHYAAAAHNLSVNPNPNNNAHFAAGFPHLMNMSTYKTGPTSYYLQPAATSMLTLEPAGFVMAGPKTEPGGGYEFNSRIALDLGGRTYFASSGEGEFVNRLWLRSRGVDPGSVNSPRCQVEGCSADLSHAKHYHRRHKVCELHSKAPTVVAGSLTQRFCQQCSRFHLLSEFDNGKRSCRRRLADHNRRRRKSHHSNQDSVKSPIINTTSSETSQRQPPLPPYFGAEVTVAISSPRVSLDCSYSTAGGGSTSDEPTSSLFY